MKIYLALFDPSHFTAEGTYWSWRSPKLDIKLLNQLYYEVAALNRPEDPNQLSNASIWGGFAAVGREFVFVYRFGNGGHDSFGRPGRFVLMVAGLSLNLSEPCELGKIVSGPIFSNLLADAKHSCPVSEPPNLETDQELLPSRVDPVLTSAVLRDKRLILPGSSAHTSEEVLSAVSQVYSTLLSKGNWQCKFHIEDETGKAVVEYVECPSKALANPDWKAESRHQINSKELTESATVASRLVLWTQNRRLIIIILCLILALTVAEISWRSIWFFRNLG